MKKIYTLLAALLLLPIGLHAQDQTFTLTTSRSAGETLTLTVNRTAEDLTVDWGDGNAVVYTPTKDALREITGTLAGQTVTVKGSKYLNTLICEGQDLTAVNLASATNLQSVYLSHNALSALAVRALGKNLLDLDCSHNALSSVSVTLSNHPNLETLNVSDNDLGSISGSTTSTNYTGGFTKLQYLNISGNGRFKSAVMSNCKELDYLDCSGNALTRLTLPTNGRLTTIDAAGNELTKIDVTPYTNLLQIDVTGNQIDTLNLSNTKVVKDVFAADNELTSASFATRASRDTLYICDLRNNRIFFNSLPRSASKIRYLNVLPQRPFPLSTSMGFKEGSVEVDGTTYTALYVTQNPSYETRSNADYIVDLTSLRPDGNGNARNTISFLDVSTEGDSTELAAYSVTSSTGDYTIVGQKYTFLKEYRKVTVRLTNATSFYRNYTFYSETFTINEPTATGINLLTTDGTNDAVYDLQGRRVSNPSSGIYIIGGKKVLIK